MTHEPTTRSTMRPRKRPASPASRWFWQVLAVACVGAVVLITWPRRTTDDLMGRRAPNFNQRTLEGASFDLHALNGRPVVLTFWSSQCASCRTAAPLLADLSRRPQESGLRVLGVVRGDQAKARELQRDLRWNFPSVVDADARIAQLYQVKDLPETLFIDANGVIRARERQPLTADRLQRHLVAIGVEH